MLIYEQFCPFLWTFISRPLNSSSHPGAMVSIDLLFFPFSHSPNSLLPRVLIYQSSFLSCHMLIIPFEFLVLDLKFPFPLNYFSGVNLHAHFYRFGARFKFGSSVVGGSSVYWLPFGSLNLFFLCVPAPHNTKCWLLLFFLCFFFLVAVSGLGFMALA